MSPSILVGAVMYDPKVATIWEGIATHFREQECPIECLYYATYGRMVDDLVAGRIDVAWNSPLAWLDTIRRGGSACRAIAMRDTDRDRVTRLVARRDSGITRIEDLAGRTIATGASDSPQATLIPLHTLREHGLRPGVDVQVRRFDVMVGKHGDHVGGELDALRCVIAHNADACAILDLNWERWLSDGTADKATLSVVGSTAPFDHCNFSVLGAFSPEREQRWLDALLAMRWDNPAHRPLMEMEGLTAWLPGRATGYAALAAAVDEEGFFALERVG